jgi:hypothetical protein
MLLHGQDGHEGVRAGLAAHAETDGFGGVEAFRCSYWLWRLDGQSSQHRNGVIGAAPADTEGVHKRFDIRVRLVEEGRVHVLLTLRCSLHLLEFDLCLFLCSKLIGVREHSWDILLQLPGNFPASGRAGQHSHTGYKGTGDRVQNVDEIVMLKIEHIDNLALDASNVIYRHVNFLVE